MTANEMARLCGVSVEELPRLTTLHAWGYSGITDAGLAHCPNLTTLYAWGNSGITDAGKRMVRERAALLHVKPA